MRIEDYYKELTCDLCEERYMGLDKKADPDCSYMTMNLCAYCNLLPAEEIIKRHKKNYKEWKKKMEQEMRKRTIMDKLMKMKEQTDAVMA